MRVLNTLMIVCLALLILFALLAFAAAVLPHLDSFRTKLVYLFCDAFSTTLRVTLGMMAGSFILVSRMVFKKDGLLH